VEAEPDGRVDVVVAGDRGSHRDAEELQAVVHLDLCDVGDELPDSGGVVTNLQSEDFGVTGEAAQIEGCEEDTTLQDELAPVL
jgi:hypothetical protein